MTKENNETSIWQLGRTWRENLKNIRLKAKASHQNARDCIDNIPAPDDRTQPHLDSDLFAYPVSEKPSVQELFAGDETFYQHKRFSTIQKVLVAAIIVVAVMLIYTLFKSRSVLPVNSQQQTAAQQTPDTQGKVESTIPPAAQNPQPEPLADDNSPVSLKLAQSYYQQADYNNAYAVYKQLSKNVWLKEEDEPLRDFFRVRMAMCIKKTGDSEQAAQLLNMVSKSSSPAAAVIANYHLALIEKQKGQYISAQTRAYQALALVNALDLDRDTALSLQRDFYYLAAETVTGEVLSLSNVNQSVPQDWWMNPADEPDVFAGLDETKLRPFLNSAAQKLSKSLLGPEIQEVSSGSMRCWSVVCSRTPIEELLAKVAVNAGLDIHWALNDGQTATRQRAASLYLPCETDKQILTIAAGCAGLLACFDENDIVNIYNPAEYSYLSQQISMLNAEAVSRWQKFLLTFQDDRRLANVHFALGLLYAQSGRIGESVAEYKLAANRFPASPLAPFALLNSSSLKNSLRDYAGAQEDLQQLVTQYPDAEVVNQAYLRLVDNVSLQGLDADAAKIYSKIYNFDLSAESQTAAAFGAGKSFYKLNDYESATKWLTRYVELAGKSGDEQLHLAWLLLGKISMATGKPDSACEAFRYALSGQLSKEEYMDALGVLVEGYMTQQRFVEALDLLEDTHFLRFSEADAIQVLLLKSRVLRAMGLIDKAVSALGDRSLYIDDVSLKMELDFESAQCLIEKNELNPAYKKLSEILVSAKSGPLAYKTAYKLGEVCFQLGRCEQTISVCQQLLELQPPDEIKQETLKLLSRAYSREKKYDDAALALLGQWK